jgi:hypothetical protein
MKRHPMRGFVLLIVLALIAVLTVLVAMQLDLLKQQSTVGLTSDESARARAIAQGCLAYLEGYAYNVLRDSGAPLSADDDGAAVIEGGFAPVDFDEVLMPGGSASSMYVPPVGDTVFMPGTVTDPLHRFKLLRMNEGGCLVRFDDNSDDAIPAQQLGFTLNATGNADEDKPDEGPGPPNKGRDNPARDRDGAIVMTAIGLYPVHTATPASGAYEAAHARVTLKRVLSAQRTGYEGAIIAGGAVKLEGNARVCGYGGVQAASLDLSSASCACGLLDVEGGVNPSNPSRGTCACGAASCAETKVLTPANDAPSYTAADLEAYWRRSTFRLSDTTTAELEDAQCSLYFQHNGKVWIWDRADHDATNPGIAGRVVVCSGGALCDSPAPHDCGDYEYRGNGEIENPCTWQADGTIRCQGEETPCWKMIADLSPGGYDDGSVWFPNPGDEWDGATEPNRIAFRRNVRIPNVKGDRRLGIENSGGGPKRHCGEPTSCNDCTGSNPAFEYVSSSEWRTVSSSSEKSLPAPGYYLMTTTNGVVKLHDVGAENDKPSRISFSVRGDVKISGKSGICGFRSKDCHEFPLSSCTELTADNTDQEFPFHVDWRNADRTVNDEAMLSAIAIQATGLCTVTTSGVLGGLSCGSVDVKNSACIYGDVLTVRGAYFDGGAIKCPCSERSNSICFTGGRPLVVGLVDGPGDVCGTSASNARLEWGIVAGGHVRMAGGMKALDYIEAFRSVTLQDRAIVTFSETTAGAFSARKVRTFQEAPW